MLCNKCIHKSFCKYYDYMINAHCLVIDLKQCDNFKNKLKNLNHDNFNENDLTIKHNALDKHIFKPTYATANNSTVLLSGKVYPDLKEEFNISSSIKNIATPIKISKAICDRCKKEVPSTDIENCVECGRPVCKNCGVAALNNGKPEFTCEKCWSGTPDPDINSEKEVTITYGEEKKEWDIEDFIETKEEGNGNEPREQVDDK